MVVTYTYPFQESNVTETQQKKKITAEKISLQAN